MSHPAAAHFSAQPALPTPDFSGLAALIGQVFTDALSGWSNTLARISAVGGELLLRQAIEWMRTSDLNFVLHTPMELVGAASDAVGLTQVRPLLQAVTGLALLIAAVSYAGHHYWGWPGMDESMQRIGVTIVLTGASLQLMDLSITLMDSMANGLAAAIPDVPGLTGIDPVIQVLLLGIWAFLLLRLLFVCGKRIVWLAVLHPFGPLAAMTFIHRKSAWIGSTFVRIWVGWLIGQVIVVVAMLACVALAARGGFGGYVLSCAALLVASEAVHIFAPKDGSLSVNVGVGPIHTSL